MGCTRIEEVIQKPLLTEKSARAQQYQNAHTFAVHRRATKLQIKKAIEQLFNTKVTSVRTMIMPRKWKRYGRTVGQSQTWKKAIVMLAEGQTIELPEAKK